MKEKMIELLMQKGFGVEGATIAADNLIANGVTIPVRCNDCKFWEEINSYLLGKVMCCTGQGAILIEKTADDFCSCGERRTDV